MRGRQVHGVVVELRNFHKEKNVTYLSYKKSVIRPCSRVLVLAHYIMFDPAYELAS